MVSVLCCYFPILDLRCVQWLGSSGRPSRAGSGGIAGHGTGRGDVPVTICPALPGGLHVRSPRRGRGGDELPALVRPPRLSLSLLCYGEPGAAGFVTPDQVPRPGCTVLCYAAARARARGLRTVGALLGVCARVELRHRSLSSSPAPPNGGGVTGRTDTPPSGGLKARAERRGGRDAVPEWRGGTCKLSQHPPCLWLLSCPFVKPH